VRDVLAVLGSLLFNIQELSALQGVRSWWTAGFLIAVSVLSAGMLWWRRRAPVLVTLLGVAAFAVTGLEAPQAVGLVTTAVRRRDRVLVALTGLAYVAYATRTAVVDGTGVTGAVFGIFMFGSLVAGGAYVGARRDLVATLRDRAERAEAERELLARDAVLTERTRIAREMHDAVGHRVSLMVLQAGAIEMAAGDRARVEQLAENVQTAGRQALEELRQMVGVLRAGETDDETPLVPQPGLTDLARLVAQTREAGMTVELRPLPESDPVDPAVGRAAFRIVQEALTNAAKHAPGASVCVTVERPDDELVVRVVSGPAGRTPAEASGGGFGLVGLGERVRTLGGRLTAEPRLDGGFAVEAVLPT
jgi:signal transduction histidine kinase